MSDEDYITNYYLIPVKEELVRVVELQLENYQGSYFWYHDMKNNLCLAVKSEADAIVVKLMCAL